MKFDAQKAKALVEASPIKESVIAKSSHIEIKTLQKYLRGEGNPSSRVICLMAKALEVPESDLMTENEDQKAG